jgi:hypothetical protein
MHSPEQYKKKTEECVRLARMGSQDVADMILALVNAWRRHAQQAELAILDGSAYFLRTRK